MERARNGLTRDQMEVKLVIAESITSLQSMPAWQDYTKAVEELIKQNTPNPTRFTAEEAVLIASKSVYCKALRDALNLVTQAAKEAIALRAELDKP